MERTLNKIFLHKLDHIRLGEFDLGGVLYHANYFHLYEEIRESFLRSIAMPYSNFVEAGQHLAVVEAHQNFLAPIRYGQELEGSLWISELKRTSAKFHYRLKSLAQNHLIHEAWTRMVFVEKDSQGFKATRLPVELSSQLNLIRHEI